MVATWFVTRRHQQKELLFLILSAVIISSDGVAQVNHAEVCEKNELQACVEMIPRTPVGLPRTRYELDARCKAYQTGMACMDVWIKRCLPTDGQRHVQQQIGGARMLMRILCTNDTAFRKAFLNEPNCWSLVSPDWSQCEAELRTAARDITERAQLLTYVNKNAELCCARDQFIACVSDAGRSCSHNASTLLRRMAWVLAQDVAACAQTRTYCDAPPTAITTPLMTLFSTLLAPYYYYQPDLF